MIETQTICPHLKSFSWIILLAIFATELQAAEVKRSSSGFEFADQGSKQVFTLKKGDTAKVTGAFKENEGVNWLPVEAGGRTGWVEANSLTLTKDDVGFQSIATSGEEPNHLAHLHYWIGVGPAAVSTSSISVNSASFAGDQYFGAGFGLGLEGYTGEEKRLVIGGLVLFPWVNESSHGYAAGKIKRISFLPSIGYSLIPQTLDLMGHAGGAFVFGSNKNFEAKLGFTIGLGLNWHLSGPEPGSLYQGISLTAMRVEETTGSISNSTSLGITHGICDGLATAFGVSNDPSCTGGAAPAAYSLTLLYKIGGQK